MFRSLSDVVTDDVFVRLNAFGPGRFLKMESLNPAGSIKLKTARGLIDDAAKRHVFDEYTVLIESSSGNLGVALAMIAAERGLRFTCVVDPNCSPQNLAVIKALGASVVRVDQKDANGGYLGSRIAYIKQKLAEDPNHVWLNQYESAANPGIHVATTARSIARAFDKVDYLFVGAGTTGTLVGCADYFSRHFPETKIIAVDSVGSVHFGQPASTRYIPGLGVSAVPPIYRAEGIHAAELVPEAQTVIMCRHVARTQGLLVGGSTGTVLAGLHAWRDRIPEGATVVAISPDWGERYLDTVYDDEWVERRFGPGVASGDLGALSRFPSRTIAVPGGSSADRPLTFVSGRAVETILTEIGSQTIADVERAYLDHQAGKTVNPDSYFLRFPNEPKNRIIALPAMIDGDRPVRGLKWISSFPDNVQRGLQRASAVLILNDPETGYAYGLLEGSRISAVRTAASAVLGADRLGDGTKRAARVAFIGGGIIARTILDTFLGDGWSFGRVSLHDIDPTTRETFVGAMREGHGLEVGLDDLEAALDAEIVVFATTAAEPYVADRTFRADQLLLNISLRDLAPETILAANNVFDDVEHCMKANTSPHLAEQKYGDRRFVTGTLAEVITGAVTLDPAKPTVFSPFGLGVLDLVVGRRVFDEAVSRGLARSIDDFFYKMER